MSPDALIAIQSPRAVVIGLRDLAQRFTDLCTILRHFLDRYASRGTAFTQLTEKKDAGNGERVANKSAMSNPLPSLDPQERRIEPRYPAHRQIVPGLTESGSAFDAQIVDVSRSGLLVRANQALHLSSTVSLRVDSLGVQGQVRHCRRNADGTFDVGLLIRDTASA
jgi:hypothetical protein